MQAEQSRDLSLVEAIAEARRSGGVVPWREGKITGEVDSKGSIHGVKREWHMPLWAKRLFSHEMVKGQLGAASLRGAIRGGAVLVGGIAGYRVGARSARMVQGAVVGIAAGELVGEILASLFVTREAPEKAAEPEVQAKGARTAPSARTGLPAARAVPVRPMIEQPRYARREGPQAIA